MNDHSIVTIVLLVQLERVLNMTTCTYMYVHYMQRIMQSVQYDRKQIEPDRLLIDRYFIKLCTQS